MIYLGALKPIHDVRARLRRSPPEDRIALNSVLLKWNRLIISRVVLQFDDSLMYVGEDPSEEIGSR